MDKKSVENEENVICKICRFFKNKTCTNSKSFKYQKPVSVSDTCESAEPNMIFG